ncbi:MAG: acyl-CoA thioesterase [Atopobiaceae bacterium]|jgi:acyl-CoA hydrolase|nr:acyl-CoA thioesterase [Atopobiaceae bacterium]
MELGSKTPGQSRVEHVEILVQGDLNGSHRLFGGQLMEWIDLCGAAVARRHSCRNVTTALVDELEFKAPAYANDMVVLEGKMIFAGHSSMEVVVDSYVEALDGSRRLINTARMTLVALDDDGRPCGVPMLVPQTDEERVAYAEAKARYLKRKREATHGE